MSAAALGLSTVELAAYEALLARSPATAAELHEAGSDPVREAGSDPVGEVVAALDRLVALGLVRLEPAVDETAPVRYRPAPPAAALQELLLGRTREMVAAHARIATLDERFQRPAGRPDEPVAVEVVHGAVDVRRRFFDLQKAATSQVRGTEGPPYMVADGGAGDTDDDTVVNLLKSGMHYRILYDRRALDLPDRPYGSILDVSDGRRVRIGTVPTKLVLTDQPAGLLPLHGKPERPPAAIVVHDPTLLAALSALFELYWERAVPVSVRARGADPDGPDAGIGTDTDAGAGAILPLLVAGLTDREVAAKLGWSHRTVRRRVSDLMARLDAQTRFQAGYNAVMRGWLEGNDDAG